MIFKCNAIVRVRLLRISIACCSNIQPLRLPSVLLLSSAWIFYNGNSNRAKSCSNYRRVLCTPAALMDTLLLLFMYLTTIPHRHFALWEPKSNAHHYSQLPWINFIYALREGHSYVFVYIIRRDKNHGQRLVAQWPSADRGSDLPSPQALHEILISKLGSLASDEVRHRCSVTQPVWKKYLHLVNNWPLLWLGMVLKHTIVWDSPLISQLWWVFKRSPTLFTPPPHSSPSLDGKNDIPCGAQELLSTFCPLI